MELDASGADSPELGRDRTLACRLIEHTRCLAMAREVFCSDISGSALGLGKSRMAALSDLLGMHAGQARGTTAAASISARNCRGRGQVLVVSEASVLLICWLA